MNRRGKSIYKRSGGVEAGASKCRVVFGEKSPLINPLPAAIRT